jgi:hypothetical protein
MKNIFRMIVIAVIAITTISNASAVRSFRAPQQEPMAGGYRDTAKDDPEALAAARFAIKEQSRKLHTRISLVSIQRAEVQVVAGLNYRLCMKVKVKRKTQTVTVVVYKNLKQKYSLTSWTPGDCREK